MSYVTSRERNEMRRMKERGATLPTIHAAFPQWHIRTIANHTRDIPAVRGRAAHNRKCDPGEAVRLRERGLKFREIGQRFGVTPVAAFQAWKRYLEKQEARA